MSFQYPLRVEVGCNQNAQTHSHKQEQFQYPLRVEVGCNLFDYWSVRRYIWFQYPLRVEVGCNLPIISSHSNSVKCFSALYGSKWVATSPHSIAGTIFSCFSTLYGSKWVATHRRPTINCNSLRVSVPSTGRSGLQLNVRARRAEHMQQFQYPLRVEVGCNLRAPSSPTFI